MKFKGTIIITDPCYVIKKYLEENPYPFPWTSDLIDSPNIDEMIKQYTEWEDEDYEDTTVYENVNGDLIVIQRDENGNIVDAWE